MIDEVKTARADGTVWFKSFAPANPSFMLTGVREMVAEDVSEHSGMEIGASSVNLVAFNRIK